MSTDLAERPAPPETPGSGLVARIVPVDGWRPAGAGATCRYHAPAMRIAGCGEPAVGEKHHPNDPVSPWWAYCGKHLGKDLGQKLWAENGAVVKWALCHADGTPATLQEIARARGKRLGTRPRPERGPADTDPHPVRMRGDLWAAAENAAKTTRSAPTASAWVRQAMQVMLGELRCPRCPEDKPPVRLKFGDLTGIPLAKAVAVAAEQVKRQHPRHEPVWVGAEPLSSLTPGPVPFKAPAVTR